MSKGHLVGFFKRNETKRDGMAFCVQESLDVKFREDVLVGNLDILKPSAGLAIPSFDDLDRAVIGESEHQRQRGPSEGLDPERLVVSKHQNGETRDRAVSFQQESQSSSSLDKDMEDQEVGEVMEEVNRDLGVVEEKRKRYEVLAQGGQSIGEIGHRIHSTTYDDGY